MATGSRWLMMENDLRMKCTSVESHMRWLARTNIALRRPLYHTSTRGRKVVVVLCHPIADGDERSLCGAIARMITRRFQLGCLEVTRLDVGDQRRFRSAGGRAVQPHPTEAHRYAVDVTKFGGPADKKLMDDGRGRVPRGIAFIQKQLSEAKFLVGGTCPNSDACLPQCTLVGVYTSSILGRGAGDPEDASR
eukprot:Polyplicarium_translucidae@DN3329_c1_g2_i17.p1